MKFYEQLPLSSEQPCFRLLQFDLNCGEDVLRGQADTYDLNDPCDIDYEALSYCWGEPNSSESVIINGETIPLSNHLCGALHQFCSVQRETGVAGKLWIDAICINQRDNAEKSHQVMLMRNIYANAKRVFSWIGEPDELSPLAFDTLRQFSIDDDTKDGSATCRELQGELDER
jgi:hypothetical protein